MKDVADVAQVSIQTVSAVINNKPGISDDTRSRVMAAIKELRYRPNSIARSLRTGLTRTIALIVSDIANPVFAALASAVEDCAHANQCSVILYNTHDDEAREASYIQKATQSWVDGVLFVATDDDRTDSLDTLREAGIHTVIIDRIPEGYNGPSVTLDNVEAGTLATNHLLDAGCRHIAHIAGPQKLRLSRERLHGFYQAIRTRNLPVDTIVVESLDWDCAHGYQAMQQILAEGQIPTAVFAANDRLAMGAIRAIADAGLTVPGDVSVIGVDDTEISSFYVPALTTIQQSFAEMGTLGIQLLLKFFNNEEIAETRITIKPRLVIRESTANCSDH